jgi:HAD superfamily hydrolase (TIGR01490 family)
MMAAATDTPLPPTAAAVATDLAVFDLDRTLVRGSSLARLARSLAEARLLRRKDLAGHLLRDAVFSARGLGPGAIDRLRVSLLQAAAGVEQSPMLEIVHRVGERIADDIFPGARWLLDRHLADGHEVVLLSSSPQELVAAVAEAIDPSITAVGTVAEVVNGFYTGLLAAPFCHGPGKLTRLEQELGPLDLTRATAYADSASDLPVLRACGSPVAVNPDRGLRDAATAAAWPILCFS